MHENRSILVYTLVKVKHHMDALILTCFSFLQKESGICLVAGYSVATERECNLKNILSLKTTSHYSSG